MNGQILVGIFLFVGWMFIDAFIRDAIVRMAGDLMLFTSMILLFTSKKGLQVVFNE